LADYFIRPWVKEPHDGTSPDDVPVRKSTNMYPSGDRDDGAQQHAPLFGIEFDFTT
jgi:hypothetical protein